MVLHGITWHYMAGENGYNIHQFDSLNMTRAWLDSKGYHVIYHVMYHSKTCGKQVLSCHTESRLPTFDSTYLLRWLVEALFSYSASQLAECHFTSHSHLHHLHTLQHRLLEFSLHLLSLIIRRRLSMQVQ